MTHDLSMLDRWLRLRAKLLADLGREDREALEWHLNRAAENARAANRARNEAEFAQEARP